jgi:hypothetical protein
MTPTDAPDYASAAHAARLIGRGERAVQTWLARAGHQPIPVLGYPVPVLCSVVNSHRWPGQFELRPEHFNADTASARASVRTPDTADAAALAVVNDLRRTLDALRADVAALHADIAALRERDEQAAQQRQDGLLRHDAALERIERAVRRVPWWKRILR